VVWIWKSGHDNWAVLAGMFLIPVGLGIGFIVGAPVADKIKNRFPTHSDIQ